MLKIIQSDNLTSLRGFEDNTFNLVYIDPPYNTGKTQTLESIKTESSNQGDRTGFGGKTYKSSITSKKSYTDSFNDYLGFMEPRLVETYRILKPDGSLFIHLDWHEVHYVKVLLDSIFGRESFMNEIIWAYDYGGRSKKKWPAKHDNILWYAKDPNNYTFNESEIDRIPYMAPGLVTKEKAERGKVPTTVWWNTIVPTNGKERTGYPTQKPLAILNRIVKVHSNPGDLLLDYFAGSGSFGEAALSNNRKVVLVDSNPEAIEVMNARLGTLTYTEPVLS